MLRADIGWNGQSSTGSETGADQAGSSVAYSVNVADHDSRIVDLYDEDNPDGPDHDFYRALADAREALTILDLGCGTGLLTVTFSGCGRRVVGIDPSSAMLAAARTREGADHVDWIQGDSTAAPEEFFDLAVMTGNVAQHISDADWARTLSDLRTRMRPGGILAFESRNPSARAWESWGSEEPMSRETRYGTLTEWMGVELIDDRTVRIQAHNLFATTDETITVTETLVFRSRAEIELDLRGAGFDVVEVHGDWSSTPFHEAARVMVFVARAR